MHKYSLSRSPVYAFFFPVLLGRVSSNVFKGGNNRIVPRQKVSKKVIQKSDIQTAQNGSDNFPNLDFSKRISSVISYFNFLHVKGLTTQYHFLLKT
jgi:hypothetical protein